MIELITVHHKEAATVRRFVMEFLRDFNETGLYEKLLQHWIAKEIIMVTDCQTDPCSSSSQLHQS